MIILKMMNKIIMPIKSKLLRITLLCIYHSNGLAVCVYVDSILQHSRLYRVIGNYIYFFLPDLFFIDKKSNGNFCNKLHN
jgi:hypothetical protein